MQSSFRYFKLAHRVNAGDALIETNSTIWKNREQYRSKDRIAPGFVLGMRYFVSGSTASSPRIRQMRPTLGNQSWKRMSERPKTDGRLPTNLPTKLCENG
jgi:hypothetical protein